MVKGSLKKAEGVSQRCVQEKLMNDVADGINDELKRVEGFIYVGGKLRLVGGCLSKRGDNTGRLHVEWTFKELSGVFCGRSMK